MSGDEMGEQLRAMDDRNAELARSCHVRHVILDRGRDDERGAIRTDSASVQKD